MYNGFFFSSRRRHTRWPRDWSSDVCSSDLLAGAESDAAPSVADIGTSARVVDFDTLPDGLLGITCIGERRFRVRRRWQQIGRAPCRERQWVQVLVVVIVGYLSCVFCTHHST